MALGSLSTSQVLEAARYRKEIYCEIHIRSRLAPFKPLKDLSGCSEDIAVGHVLEYILKDYHSLSLSCVNLGVDRARSMPSTRLAETNTS